MPLTRAHWFAWIASLVAACSSWKRMSLIGFDEEAQSFHRIPAGELIRPKLSVPPPTLHRAGSGG